MFFTPVFVFIAPLPPVNFLHVSTITAPLNTKVTVINLSIFCNICPSSYIIVTTPSFSKILTPPHPRFLLNKFNKSWLVSIPPLCPHILDGPWRCAVCKCQALSPHHWQPFMLCDYDFQQQLPPLGECEQVDIASGPPPWHSYTGYYHFIWHNNLISITPFRYI